MQHESTLHGGVIIGLALTDRDRLAAARLVHDCYVDKGYRDASAAAPALPARARALLFVARGAGRVVATVTLLLDSPAGLPVDALYPRELRALRGRRRRLAEVSALAVSEAWRRQPAVLRALMQTLGVYARQLAGVEDLCITVHPRHADFYERRLAFERFGAERPCAAVNGAPAIGLRLDLGRAPTTIARGRGLGRHACCAEEIARVHHRLCAELISGVAPMKKLHADVADRPVALTTTAEVC